MNHSSIYSNYALAAPMIKSSLKDKVLDLIRSRTDIFSIEDINKAEKVLQSELGDKIIGLMCKNIIGGTPDNHQALMMINILRGEYDEVLR